ncbi:MAG: SIS domain-containing protein [Bacteroidales bacterium]|nr:SIS domain-containing protein [Bacteroidales bacterium]MCI2121318.1 SIS domain-containing protein [Bacteroidales bacterium]MCI2145932.1 SIS domain-containing protein [Bacteroidales bacterium]
MKKTEKGFNTKREILQQPEMWRETYDLISQRMGEFKRFLSDKGIGKSSEIIFCGAGSSEFVADAVSCLFVSGGYCNARSVATTDLVTNPEFYVHKDDTLLAFTFARSGNSPESIGAYKMLNRFCKNAYHVIITCNRDGDILDDADPEKDFVFVLPDPTDDVSLVMTSSFSSMAVAAMLLRDPEAITSQREKVAEASALAGNFFAPEVLDSVADIAKRDIRRAVVLGGGPLKGIARECHLKMQEMTDGAIMSAYDSFMGLRHGPKAVIKDDTLVVYLLSDDEYSRLYEYDLMRQINAEHNPMAQVAVSKKRVEDEGIKLDMQVNAPDCSPFSANPYTYVAYVIIGQILGYHFSLHHGLNPDSPSVSGVISRVVSGVKLY